MTILEKYEEWLNVKGLSQRTIETYLHKIKKLMERIDIENLSKDVLSKYLLNIKKRGCSAKTVNLHRFAIISFCTFLGKEIDFPDRMKEKNKTIDYFNEEYFHDTIIYTAERIFENMIQKKAILYFMFYTGVRKEEVVKTSRNDIDLNKRLVKIKGKGGKERILPFTKETSNVLKAYFLVDVEIESAFNISNTSAIDYIFRQLSEWTGKHINPHKTSHSFDVMCRKKGLAIEEIQYLMGHKDIATTQRYARIVDSERVMDNYRKLVG